MTNRVTVIPNWWFEFKPNNLNTNQLFVISGINEHKPIFNPKGPSKGKWIHSSKSSYRVNKNGYTKTKQYGPVEITNLKQWKKRPIQTDIEITVGNTKYLLSYGNMKGGGVTFDTVFEKLK